MIKRIKLKNYKSFSEIDIDFSISLKDKKNFSFIYGENGSGKSNIISIIHFLKTTLTTLNNNERFSKLLHEVENSKKDEELIEYFKQLPYNQTINLKKIITSENAHYLGSAGDIEIDIEFLIDNKPANYFMKLNENEGIVEERLSYLVKKIKGQLFSLSKENGEVIFKKSPSLYDSKVDDIVNDLINRYWGNHTFLSIINFEMSSKSINKKYLDESFNDNLFNFINYINKISVDYKNTKFRVISQSVENHIFENLEFGRINNTSENYDDIKNIEKLLNYIFQSLYTDINKVYYKLDDNDKKIKYELYFKKKVSGKSIDIPFSLESSGTNKILELIPMFISLVKGKIVVIDEIDTEIHDLLMKAMIEGFMDIETGQLIATTHNTMLLQTLDKNNVYVIDIDEDSNKKLINLAKHENKLQSSNSLYHQYLNGKFGGIPYIDYLDAEHFAELTEDYLS